MLARAGPEVVMMSEQEAIAAAIRALGYEGADDAEACVRVTRHRGRWYALDAEYPEDTGHIHLGRATPAPRDEPAVLAHASVQR